MTGGRQKQTNKQTKNMLRQKTKNRKHKTETTLE